MCKVLEQNQTLRRKLDDLQFELLVSDQELILEFETEDEKRICPSAGSA